jgi:hypothetical protein
MANAISNTYVSADAIGNREDLSDVINNISPTKTPFMSMVKKGKAEAVKFEWQTDALATAVNNKVNEGSDHTSTFTAAVATARLHNYCQISEKEGLVSGTQDAVSKAGRKKELAYQVAKRGAEMKRDIEYALTNNGTLSSTDARQTRGLPGWLATNCLFGAGAGAAPIVGSNTAAVAGTARAFTESLLKSNLQSVWTAGGDPTIIMVNGALKQTLSTFTGNATRTDKSEDKKLYAAIDVYASDFGDLKVVPNRFMPTDAAFVLDMDYWTLNYLRPITKSELAKTGDAEKFMIIAEYGLEAGQEASSGQIRDLA